MVDELFSITKTIEIPFYEESQNKDLIDSFSKIKYENKEIYNLIIKRYYFTSEECITTWEKYVKIYSQAESFCKNHFRSINAEERDEALKTLPFHITGNFSNLSRFLMFIQANVKTWLSNEKELYHKLSQIYEEPQPPVCSNPNNKRSVKKYEKDVEKYNTAHENWIKNINKQLTKRNSFKERKIPTMKNGIIVLHNRYELTDDGISILLFDGDSLKKKCWHIVVDIPPTIRGYLSKKKIYGMKIYQKDTKPNVWYLAIPVTKTIPIKPYNGITMGIDLGIKHPAACVIMNDAISPTLPVSRRFFGKGKLNRDRKARYGDRMAILQQKKAKKAMTKWGNHYSRRTQSEDHLISARIVQYAVENNVSVIKFEDLKDIRKNKNEMIPKNHKNRRRDLNSWTFFRLKNYIKYKAELKGISVVEVNSTNTSKICPICGAIQSADDRKYECKKCGYIEHRDFVGAINVAKRDGKLLSRPNKRVTLDEPISEL